MQTLNRVISVFKQRVFYLYLRILLIVKRVDWIAPIDIYILEFFVQHDVLLTPKVVALNIDYDQSYVGKRCRHLADHGLLEQEDRGVFSLAETGREYIESGLDAGVLDE